MAALKMLFLKAGNEEEIIRDNVPGWNSVTMYPNPTDIFS
jgi:hypothetical protein